MKTTTKDYFNGLVGQDNAKRKIAFFIKSYMNEGDLPHIMFVAPKGTGKTAFAHALGSNLTQQGSTKPKPLIVINCSTIKNLKQFFNELVIPILVDRDATVFFDECSELPKDVTMALLTMLNPNKERRTEFTYEDYTFHCDFKRLSFIFATTEAQDVFHALMDRCERIDLEDYSHDELAQIMQLINDKQKWEGNVLHKIATTLRGNARKAQQMADKIRLALSNKSSRKGLFTKKDWKGLSYTMTIFPLGLTTAEIKLLRTLSEQKYTRLTNLSAKLGLSKACIQRDHELYLQKHNLMEVTPHGRAISTQGIDYLKKLGKQEMIDKYERENKITK
jgi:Holliday junction resolvasome RuvABC ATP-dependent DNA helicase subunit